MSSPLTRRFSASTRGRIVALLRAGPRTVDELASALSLTDNAVRPHLMGLERDGMVRQAGVRRGEGTAVSRSPQICAAVESLVGEISGATVTECCDRTNRPRCCFELRAAGS